ncbi:MerR family transcriptional regulator [soil metagenome]
MKVYRGVMTTALKIKDVAAASGFTPATLRYYEQIGLLPEAARTPAGYRTYDERTLDRLAFIARAKQLGCTLDEITGLTTAWDGGLCGPIQDQLRRLVASKIAAAQTQITELMTFTGELHQAAAALERHRPEGACDTACGCVNALDESASVSAVIRTASHSAKPPPAQEPAIACTLSAGSMKGRIEDWQALLDHVVRREPIEGGVRSVFSASVPTDELVRLVAAEQDCCQFFQFAITIDTRGVSLEVRAPDEALPIVTSMFGTPSRAARTAAPRSSASGSSPCAAQIQSWPEADRRPGLAPRITPTRV